MVRIKLVLRLSIIVIVMISMKLSAQTDTLGLNVDIVKPDITQSDVLVTENQAVVDTNDLLNEIENAESVTQELLPESMIFTQRMLWGKNGLMRHFDAFKLTPENRIAELKVRRVMLVSHQILGFATLGGMIAQGIVGAKLYQGDGNLKDAHEALATGVNIAYFTTAGLSLFTPPKMLADKEGYSSIKVHMGLAIVHLTSMIATNVLAGQLETNENLRPYHRATAFTAFGTYAAAMIIIKF